MHPNLPKLVRRLGFLIAVVLSSSMVQAQIFDANDPTLPASADGFNLTLDTISDLEWLDVNLTTGRTYDDLIGLDGTNEFGPGGDFEGFRHATALELIGVAPPNEVHGMFRYWGWVSSLESTSELGNVTEFLSYFGCRTGVCSTYGSIQGLFVTDLVSPLQRWALLQTKFTQLGNAGYVSFPLSGPALTTSENGSTNEYGHFLVRPLPEPGGAGAVVAGILMLAALARLREGPRSA